MPQIDPQKNIIFYYNFTSKFFESDKFQIKPRPEWKKSAICFLFGTILSLLVFLLLSKVPYAGPVFFLAGFAGFLYCLVFLYKRFSCV